MKKIFYLVPVVVAVLIITISLQSKPDTMYAYHVTLADPKLYKGGIFVGMFKIQKGSYQFSFVPNGDSPQLLSIYLVGTGLDYHQDFKLNGTQHNTGISNYYTWTYVGNKDTNISDDQNVTITVDPHSNIQGSVSIYLIKK